MPMMQAGIEPALPESQASDVLPLDDCITPQIHRLRLSMPPNGVVALRSKEKPRPAKE
jgi:hypothetical protein